jgi:hypothetical protein
MNRELIIKCISCVILLAGLLIMIGWVFDIEALKTATHFGVTTKFVTALAFALSGFVLLTLHNASLKKINIILTAGILLLMGVSFVGNLVGISFGAEKLFFSAVDNERFTGVPGYPSIMTCISFLLFGLAATCRLLRKNCTWQMSIPGMIIIAVGAMATLGYALDISSLYYYFHDLTSFSTAMSQYTAALFILLGSGMVLSQKRGAV